MVLAAMQTRLGNAFAYRWRSASMPRRWNPLPNFGRWTSWVAAVSTLKQFSPPSAEMILLRLDRWVHLAHRRYLQGMRRRRSVQRSVLPTSPPLGTTRYKLNEE